MPKPRSKTFKRGMEGAGTALYAGSAYTSYTAAIASDMQGAIGFMVAGSAAAMILIAVSEEYGPFLSRQSLKPLAAWFAVICVASSIYFTWEWSRRPAPPLTRNDVQEVVSQALKASNPPAPTISETQISGTLEPDSEPTPQNPCSGMGVRRFDGLSNTLVLLGDNAVSRGDDGEFTALAVGQCPVVAFKKTGDHLVPDISLYDEAGRLISRIRDGKIDGINSQEIKIDRDGDLSSLRVIYRATGKEILFVHYLNLNTVRVRGMFGCPGHRVIQITDNQIFSSFPLHRSCIMNAGGIGIQAD